jgi:nitrogen regulatory protein PII
VFVTSDFNQYRFRELATTDPSFPDVTIALSDSNVEEVVTRIIKSITTSEYGMNGFS